MPCRILITQDIKKQIGDLPGNVRTIARQAIANLANNPRPSQSKELAGHPEHYRMHISTKYRLVWRVSENENLIEVEYIGVKSPNIYKSLGLERPD